VRPLGGAEVAAFPFGEDGAHEVQVLRHRLPRRPHSFERFLALEEKLDEDNAAVTEVAISE
jgi:hypothetical protein